MYARPWVALLLSLAACRGSEEAPSDGFENEPDAALAGERDAGVQGASDAGDADAGGTDASAGDPTIVSYERHFDDESATYYYLTRVKHTDQHGQLVRLRHAHAARVTGETVPEFAKRMGNPALAINASTMLSSVDAGVRQAVGVQIIDGVVVQERSTSGYTLGIKADNELVAYPPKTTASAMLNDGATDALTAFVPLIEDHAPVSDEVLARVDNLAVKHPRQSIWQLDDLDLLVFSCGGRGFDGEGMTARDVIRIARKVGVKFAFMLDGGGSVATVIHGELITKKIDKSGTEDRPRPNFLYVE